MNILYKVLWILLALLLQVLLFNHLYVWGGVALVYVISLIKLPVELNRNIQILIGFLVGITIDIFCNTIGLHALVATTLMWIRIPLLHLFVNAEDLKEGSPGFSRMGVSEYTRYSISIILVYCLLLYVIESFTLFNLPVLLLKVLISTSMTFLISIALEFVALKN